jgi:hypothetical protein
MRTVSAVLLVGLLTIPVALWCQAKESFKTRLSIGSGDVEATLTFSEKGYEWTTTGQYHSNGLTPWSDVRTWACAGETYGFPLTLHHQTGVTIFKFRHDDLIIVVNKWLKKYAADKLDKGEGCKPES